MVYDYEHIELKQRALENEKNMQEQTQTNDQLFETQVIDPNDYIETVLNLYRQDEGDYRGRRAGGDQELIAELSTEEADEYFDTVIIGLTGISRAVGHTKNPFVKPSEAGEADVRLGKLDDSVSLKDMRASWRQLWTGFSVLTHRLKRDSTEFQQTGLPELFFMDGDNKALLMSKMFSNFQDLNALRFGVQGSNVMRNRWVADEITGRPVKKRVDADIAPDAATVAQNAATRHYNAITGKGDDAIMAVHAAGKMTPKEFKALRRLYPEVDMDRFAHDAARSKYLAKHYGENEE